MFAGQNFTFFESMVIFNEEDENWVYAINTNYKETLNIEMSDAIKQKSQLCICTMIDMSEVGCFNRKLLEPILKYIEEHQMTIVDKIRGIIICRGYQNNKYLNCKMKLELRNWDKGACPFIPIRAAASPYFQFFV